ncbi:MAG: hypothetical protein H6858_09800 [Rhodospirillales bacterium]|nr:hypothetical protein [Alphaproteobacteria bacterium]MCB1839468.1 hypothetical protein [Alphaproteobacteria bacterium]MCB9977879.1 hypothetical protein [Rhodospirillales bacterium]
MRNVFIFFSVFFALGIFFADCVFANVSSDYKASELEKGVFAFFHLGDKSPDFDYWVKSTKHYEELSEKQQEEYLISESIRLGTGYGQFDVKKDLLHIETIVEIHYSEPEGDQPGKIYFQFPEQDDEYIPTFSYPYGHNEWVSLIINRLALFAEMPVQPEHLEAIKKRVPEPNVQYEAMLTLDVRPTKADHSAPIKIGTMAQWIMIGEIAYMKCEIENQATGKMMQLWDFVAPWYLEEYNYKNMPEDMKYPSPFDLMK